MFEITELHICLCLFHITYIIIIQLTLLHATVVNVKES